MSYRTHVQVLNRLPEVTADFIEEIEQRHVRGSNYFYSQYNKVTAGDLLSVTIYRDGTKETFIGICSAWTRKRYRIIRKLTEQGLSRYMEFLLEKRL